MRLSLDFVLMSVDGILLAGDGSGWVEGVSTDSRKIQPGELFFALSGDNFDGHDYIGRAWEAGAAAVIVANPQKVPGTDAPGTVILVRNTLEALQKLAGAFRQQFALPVVAVTGSVGKTTTKDILAECLAPLYRTLKTPGNFNNDIGLPLTLMKLEPGHGAAVVELGMSAPGEISRLAGIVKPTYAIITNVEPVHLETMGNMENIARAKCEILDFIAPDKFVLLNGDDALLCQTAENFAVPQYKFGYNTECDIRILEVQATPAGLEVKLSLWGQSEIFSLPVPAKRLAANLAAAVGMAYLLGISLAEVKAGLLNYRPSGNRLNLISLPAGGLIINDTYNANPVSMMAALEVCQDLAAGRRTVAVLGDMLELGDYEVEGHIKVGEKAAELKLDVLVTIGERAAYIGQGAVLEGMPAAQVVHFKNQDESLAWLKQRVSQQEVVLFKGSRGMELEKLVNKWLT
ncbi:MAG: UDP-N-acetylmuramoyl-tripeptide--D-alanyl-D-alanine ligase [Syntrophomonadaceae bacterium]|nr:UDP-N-acetylmuramoyl-tripeptide--D-alanyl-D-alanine ligase [Syntrophomonadaceae bacterium]